MASYTTGVNLRLSAEEKRRLELIAKQLGISQQRLIREGIELVADLPSRPNEQITAAQVSGA